MARRKKIWKIYAKIGSFENLYLAAQKARKGKRYRADVLHFHLNLERELLKLREELLSKTYSAGLYRDFYIYEPKKRLISAAPYRDRVVHHALCNYMVPIFEPSFIDDSYANRSGKGTHMAILRYQAYCKQYKYVLKCDIRQFFPSIHHGVLLGLIGQRIGCPDTLALCEHIIATFNGANGKGLPIGNLTSQFWANVYMNPLDHFVKDMQAMPYLRYVDDFAIFSDDKIRLRQLKSEINEFLKAYHLELHPRKSHVHQSKEGLRFLGHRVFPEFRLLDKENIRRFKKRLKKRLKQLEAGEISQAQFDNGLQSWEAHAAFSNTYRLRKALLAFRDASC